MKTAAFLLAVAISGALGLSPANAQKRPNIFANPKNLKVLPKDISPAELGNTMKGFALGLGVRCTHCHVGQEGKPLSSFDFPNDRKETKLIAREMLKMMTDINRRVGRLDRGPEHKFVEVECVTCHRGQNRPRLIQSVLAEEYEKGGADGAMARYRDLRKKFYGGHTFDFGEFALSGFANGLMARGNTDDGIALLAMNAEFHPESAFARASLGNAWRRKGDLVRALEHFRKALQLNPKMQFAAGQIKAIKAELNGQEAK